MRAKDHQELRQLLGAYVLDQLGEPERLAVDAHLKGCSECLAEVASLSPVVTALRGLDPTLAELPADIDDLGESVLQRIRQQDQTARRRARVQRAGAGLLAVASFAAAFAIGTWFGGPRNTPPVVDVALQLSQPGLRADAGLVEHTWGTELKLQATGLTRGASYTVTFVREDGSRVAAGTFLGTGDQPVRCSVNAALPLETAAAFQITDPAGALVMDADIG